MASDEDRELVADRLREATGEGRLLPSELEDRLSATFSARTHGQLDVLVADLPGPRRGQPAVPIWARATLGVAGAVGVLAAATAAALLFSLIAFLSAAWMVLGRMLGTTRGQRRRPRGSSRQLPRPDPRVIAAGRTRRAIAARSERAGYLSRRA